MKEDLTLKMYRILADSPDSEKVLAFLEELALDKDLEQVWQDFLTEQYLAGTLSEDWREYVIKSVGLQENIEFQQQIQEHIRASHEQVLREEIRQLLPREDKGTASYSRNRRLHILIRSTAAIAILAVGVWLYKSLQPHPSPALASADIPVLIVEPFELEGVTDDMLMHGIPQRLPAKLAVTEGIYPVSEEALNAVGNRVGIEHQADEIGASYAVRGKVRKVGARLLIDAKFVNLTNNQAIWADQFRIPDSAKAFDDVQDALSLRIANTLKLSIRSDARERMSREVSRDPDAVGLFLRAEKALYRRNEQSIGQSINLFTMALSMDSASTIIRGYLAYACAIFVESDWGDSTYWDLARDNARKTLDMDPENPEALIVFGDYAFHENENYDSARGYFLRALRSRPGDAKIHQALAELSIRTGEIEEGINHIRIARKLDPDHRVIRWLETKYFTAIGQLETAREAAHDLMKIDPEFPHIQGFDWQYYLSKQQYAAALEAIPVRDSNNQWRADYMEAMTYLDAGMMNEFKAVYPIFDPSDKSSFDLLVKVHTGEWDAVHNMLRRLLQDRKFDLLPFFQTADFAIFNKMKSDPEVREILLEYGIHTVIIPHEDEHDM